jgi:hypothetical protein
MLMGKAKRGRPKCEPTNLRSIRLPNRIWKLVVKQSKNNRSVNEYILSVIEDELIEKKVLDSSLRRSPVTKSKGD